MTSEALWQVMTLSVVCMDGMYLAVMIRMFPTNRWQSSKCAELNTGKHLAKELDFRIDSEVRCVIPFWRFGRPPIPVLTGPDVEQLR